MTWIGYVRDKPASLRYRDSVVAMWHQVDVDLPADALPAAHAGVDLADVGSRYLEPMSALQDDDLTLPDPVEFAYFAIYNCFCKYVRDQDIPDWLIVNQALSVHDNDAVAARLTRAIDDIDPITNGNGENAGSMG